MSEKILQGLETASTLGRRSNASSSVADLHSISDDRVRELQREVEEIQKMLKTIRRRLKRDPSSVPNSGIMSKILNGDYHNDMTHYRKELAHLFTPRFVPTQTTVPTSVSETNDHPRDNSRQRISGSAQRSLMRGVFGPGVIQRQDSVDEIQSAIEKLVQSEECHPRISGQHSRIHRYPPGQTRSETQLHLPQIVGKRIDPPCDIQVKPPSPPEETEVHEPQGRPGQLVLPNSIVYPNGDPDDGRPHTTPHMSLHDGIPGFQRSATVSAIDRGHFINQLRQNRETVDLTLVFTDIQGSTSMMEEDPEKTIEIIAKHFEIMYECLERNNGQQVKTEGDSLMATFDTPQDAIQFSLDTQASFAHHDWPDWVREFDACKMREEHKFFGPRVRIGIYKGPNVMVIRDIGGRVIDYFGPPVHRAARLGNFGPGGFTWVPMSIMKLIYQDSVRWKNLLCIHKIGEHMFAGIRKPLVIYCILPIALKDRLKSEKLLEITNTKRKKRVV